MDEKFDKLIHIQNIIGLKEDDIKELMPLILEALEIKISDLPIRDKGDFLFDSAKKKDKIEHIRLAREGKESADKKATLFINIYEILKKVSREDLDMILEEIARKEQVIGSSSSDTPNTTSSNNTDSTEKKEEKEFTKEQIMMETYPLLKEHSDDIIFQKDGVNIYKPRGRGIYEKDEDYLAFLKEYYRILEEELHVFEKKENSKINEIENKIEEIKKKIEESLKEIERLKKLRDDLLSPENMASKSPEELAKENQKINDDLMKAIANYQFNLNKLKELNRDLEGEKKKEQKGVPLLPPGREVPLLPPGRDVPLLPPGTEPSEEITEEIIETTPEPSEETSEEVTEETTGEIIEPTPEPSEETTEEVTEETTEETREINTGRRLETIINELVNGIGIRSKDNRAYNLSNIQVGGTLKRKLKQGNYLYNLVAGLNIGTYLSVPFNFIRKLRGKVMMRPDTKNRIEELKSRINALSEADLMVIYKEYRGDRSGQNRDVDLLNTLLGERIGRFVNEKVAEINAKLTALYKKIVEDFKKISELNKRYENTNNPNEREAIEREISGLLDGKINDITEIEKLQKEGRNWYSGGWHGFEEDMKAASSKMSFIGKRFSKSNNTNEALTQEEARLVEELDIAIQNGDNEAALYAFLQKEKLLSDNTVIKKSIFGKRSVGDRYYQPLVTKVDYRNDPFVSDLVGAVATAGGIINIASQARNIANAKAAQDSLNAQIDQINSGLSSAEAKVRGYGDQISGHSDTVLRGGQAQSVQTELGYMNTAERQTLDATNWGISTSQYNALDNATHAAYNERYFNIQSQMGDITGRYQSGMIGVPDALREFAQVSAQQQQGLVDLLTQYKPILENYAATHSFNLDSVMDSINNIIANPYAISDMYSAQAAIAQIGQELQQFTLAGGTAAVDLTMQIWPQILASGSAYVLALNVARQMEANAINGKYGNEIIELIGSLDTSALNAHR